MRQDNALLAWLVVLALRTLVSFNVTDAYHTQFSTHEMEKQYICQYCANRFKNKNEAERHQNSLHLRRHSWSCAALSSYEAAFHPSNTPTTTTSATQPVLLSPQATVSRTPPHDNSSPPRDTCGYCGAEFPNPPDWDARLHHLNDLHKYGECNHNKKFFRADHFRQHLKHSHGGTSGRWTNVLENACMRDEPPPQPIMEIGGGVHGGLVVGQAGGQAPHLMGVLPGSALTQHLPPRKAREGEV